MIYIPNSITKQSGNLIKDLKILINQTRTSIAKTINHEMVKLYFEIGHKIVEHEQAGKDRAEYGKKLIKQISKELTIEFGKGFALTQIKQMKQLYLTYRIGRSVTDQFNPELSKISHNKCHLQLILFSFIKNARQCLANSR